MQIHIENWGEERDKKIKTIHNLANNVLVYLFSYIPCMGEKLHIFMYMDSHVCVYYERSKSPINLY